MPRNAQSLLDLIESEMRRPSGPAGWFTSSSALNQEGGWRRAPSSMGGFVYYAPGSNIRSTPSQFEPNPAYRPRAAMLGPYIDAMKFEQGERALEDAKVARARDEAIQLLGIPLPGAQDEGFRLLDQSRGPTQAEPQNPWLGPVTPTEAVGREPTIQRNPFLRRMGVVQPSADPNAPPSMMGAGDVANLLLGNQQLEGDPQALGELAGYARTQAAIDPAWRAVRPEGWTAKGKQRDQMVQALIDALLTAKSPDEMAKALRALREMAPPAPAPIRYPFVPLR